MFERFGDLPLHVLVIHLAVVLLPVAALTAIVFALVPQWRWLLRWPVLVLGVVSFVVAFVARKSGEAFVAAIPGLQQAVAPAPEARRPVVLVLPDLRGDRHCRVPDPQRAIPSGQWKGCEGNEEPPPRGRSPSVAVVVIAVLVIWQTIRTGDAGAKAVWGGQLPPK